MREFIRSPHHRRVKSPICSSRTLNCSRSSRASNESRHSRSIYEFISHAAPCGLASQGSLARCLFGSHCGMTIDDEQGRRPCCTRETEPQCMFQGFTATRKLSTVIGRFCKTIASSHRIQDAFWHWLDRKYCNGASHPVHRHVTGTPV